MKSCLHSCVDDASAVPQHVQDKKGHSEARLHSKNGQQCAGSYKTKLKNGESCRADVASCGTALVALFAFMQEGYVSVGMQFTLSCAILRSLQPPALENC